MQMQQENEQKAEDGDLYIPLNPEEKVETPINPKTLTRNEFTAVIHRANQLAFQNTSWFDDLKFYFAKRKVRKHGRVTDRIIDTEQLYRTVEEMPLSQDVLPHVPQAMRDVLSDRRNYSISKELRSYYRLARIKTKSKARNLTSSVKEGLFSFGRNIADFFNNIFSDSSQYATTTVPEDGYILRNDEEMPKYYSKSKLEEISINHNKLYFRKLPITNGLHSRIPIINEIKNYEIIIPKREIFFENKLEYKMYSNFFNDCIKEKIRY